MNDLLRAAFDSGEGGAEQLVAGDQLRQAGFERWSIERAVEPSGDGDVVEGVIRFELIEEPESLLSRGEWQGLGAVGGEQRSVRARSGLGTIDGCGKLR